MAFFLLQKFKKRADFHGSRYENRFGKHRIGNIIFIIVVVKIGAVDNAYDIIKAVNINGQTGISGFDKNFGDFLFCPVCFHRFNINAGSCDIRGIVFVKFDYIADKLAFLFAYTAAVFDFIDHRKKLFFGNGVVIAAFDNH